MMEHEFKFELKLTIKSTKGLSATSAMFALLRMEQLINELGDPRIHITAVKQVEGGDA